MFNGPDQGQPDVDAYDEVEPIVQVDDSEETESTAEEQPGRTTMKLIAEEIIDVSFQRKKTTVRKIISLRVSSPVVIKNSNGRMYPISTCKEKR